MTKLLRPALLFVFVLFSFIIQAQEDVLKETIGQFSGSITTFDFSIHQKNIIEQSEKVFSYENCNHDHLTHNDHNEFHSESISLMDIISPDEGADVNCSGGFCMHESHFHKKGLTLRRQLFDYFMKISC
ncbi:hypothetical protein J8L88_16555 [Aquimarina sp. MMG015]|uniref:hypothetical protein n=1 Tax=Aquimarina TaxID=290174 RepID=UPI0003F53D85|nr:MULTISPECIES: hypothetical protein [Aquimarina]AXT55694.1 hypothetical protein D1815_07985 [Aquimarina sp. AD1]MBQ4804474.1 hypothetical protein [Aquimarina sp. MMG015]RKN28659.1 hypothetical protein D7035_07780 [Aquimarina sp. AD1]